MNIIVKMKFGSHLYGIDTPESDLDYKGIFMPEREDILLGKIPKCITTNTKSGTGKNTKEDIDTDMYSLHHFIKLACEGQTVAIDMLNAPPEMILQTSDTWKDIVYHRYLFISKNMTAFLGYCKTQAAKYGIKGSRLAAAKSVLDFIDSVATKENLLLEIGRVKQYFDRLPEGEHIHKDAIDPNGLRVYEVCGKKVQETASISYLYNVIERFYEAYGARAKLAEKNLGIDWKAVSHALRVAIELKELYTVGKIYFPLYESGYITAVKLGLKDYKKEIAPILEETIEEVRILSEASTYPEKVNVKYWNNSLLEFVSEFIEKGEY